MNIIKLILLIVSCCVSMQMLFSVSSQDIYISGVGYSSQNYIDKIGIVVLNNGNIQDNDMLIVEFTFNKEMLENTCKHEIIFNSKNSYNKNIYCPIPSQETNGLYSANIKLQRNEKTLLELEPYEFYYNSMNSFSKTTFTNTPQGTQVQISLPQNIEIGDIIHHEIPKEVIPLITPQTQDSLISSEKKFKIIKQDPIIAWEVTSKSETIEYVVLNSTINETQKVDFKTYAKEERPLSTLVIFSIVGLLVIIFVPLFFKK